MSNDASLIAAFNVEKKFGYEEVLKGIDFTLQKGEILGILGPSGSGKTTLIKCIIGMHKLNNGSINIMNTTIPNLKIMDNIGYMAQSDALYEDLTGIDNLIFFARLSGMKKKNAKQESMKLFDLVGLKGQEKKRVVHYSGGMKRRLSLAAALIRDPKIIILDEPTVGIDPVLRETFWLEFDKRKKEGKGIIVTTHVMDEAERCSRLILLREGKIIAFDQPDKLKSKYQCGSIEEVFLKLSKEQL